MSSFTFQDGITPQDAAHMNLLEQTPRKAQANGYASLDSSGKVPLAQLPPVGASITYKGDWAAGSYQDGDVVVYNGVEYMCVRATSAAPVPWPLSPTAATYGTTLPASPVDGQEAILVDSVTTPTYQWRFRYNAQSAAAQKWEFVGGSPLYSGLLGTVSGSVTNNAFLDLPSGPTLVVPRAGVYSIRHEAFIQANTMPAAFEMQTRLKPSTTAPSGKVGDVVANVVFQGCRTGLDERFTFVAGETLNIQYAALNATAQVNVNNGSLALTPVRVA